MKYINRYVHDLHSIQQIKWTKTNIDLHFKPVITYYCKIKRNIKHYTIIIQLFYHSLNYAKQMALDKKEFCENQETSHLCFVRGCHSQFKGHFFSITKHVNLLILIIIHFFYSM